MDSAYLFINELLLVTNRDIPVDDDLIGMRLEFIGLAKDPFVLRLQGVVPIRGVLHGRRYGGLGLQ